MYFRDLEDASQNPNESQASYWDNGSVYVGWLAPEEGYEVNKGPVPEGFVEALRWAITRQGEGGPFHDGLAHRGCHHCAMCEGSRSERAASNHVVTIPGPKYGYMVPGMIVHYVEAHGYQPPEEFIQVVMEHWQKHKTLRESQGTRGVMRRMLNG